MGSGPVAGKALNPSEQQKAAEQKQIEDNYRQKGMVKDQVSGNWGGPAEIAKMAHDRAQAAQFTAQGLNPDGSPKRPEYQTLLDPKSGLMQDQFQLKGAQIDPNSLEGFNLLKKDATRTGLGSWAQMMLQKGAADKALAVDESAQAGASAAATGRAALAMKGGLSAGASTSLAKQQMRDQILARQRIMGQSDANRFNILSQDENQRADLLTKFTGFEGDLSKFNKGNELKTGEYNIGNALTEKRTKDANETEVYKEQLKQWGANKQAEATRNSGGGGK